MHSFSSKILRTGKLQLSSLTELKSVISKSQCNLFLLYRKVETWMEEVTSIFIPKVPDKAYRKKLELIHRWLQHIRTWPDHLFRQCLHNTCFSLTSLQWKAQVQASSRIWRRKWWNNVRFLGTSRSASCRKTTKETFGLSLRIPQLPKRLFRACEGNCSMGKLRCTATRWRTRLIKRGLVFDY